MPGNRADAERGVVGQETFVDTKLEDSLQCREDSVDRADAQAPLGVEPVPQLLDVRPGDLGGTPGSEAREHVQVERSATRELRLTGPAAV